MRMAYWKVLSVRIERFRERSTLPVASSQQVTYSATRPKTCIDQWVDAGAKLYALARSERWDASQRGGTSETGSGSSPG